MTLTEWIASLPADTRGNVVLESFKDGGTITITPTNLASLLSGISTVPPTYAELSALPIATDGGWQKYFDVWKAQGLIT